MRTYTAFKKRVLKRSDVRKAYEELGPRFEVITSLIKKRLEKGLTQADVASSLGTHQSAIARLESGSENPTLSYLNEVAIAVGGKLHVRID